MDSSGLQLRPVAFGGSSATASGANLHGLNPDGAMGFGSSGGHAMRTVVGAAAKIGKTSPLCVDCENFHIDGIIPVLDYTCS